MATATAQVTDSAADNGTTQVKVTVKKVRWYHRAWNWLRRKGRAAKEFFVRTGRRIRSFWNKARTWVASKARTAARWGRRTWGWTKMMSRRIWAFAKRNVKAVPTLARRGAGYALRGISWVFKTVWNFATSGFAVIVGAMLFILWAMDVGQIKYEESVHSRVVRMSQPKAGDVPVDFGRIYPHDHDLAEDEEVDFAAPEKITVTEEMLANVGNFVVVTDDNTEITVEHAKTEDDLRKMSESERRNYYQTQYELFQDHRQGEGLRLASYWTGRLDMVMAYMESPLRPWFTEQKAKIYASFHKEATSGYFNVSVNQYMKGVKEEHDLLRELHESPVRESPVRPVKKATAKKTASAGKRS